MPTMTVYPPDEEGGRCVRIDGQIAGRATSVEEIARLLEGAGWAGVDVASAGWVVWRGGGPDAWEH